MRQKDIDRLKEICEKEGLHFDWDYVDHSAIILREKKDPWDGVEFVEYILDTTAYYIRGKIYPFKKITDKTSLWTKFDEELSGNFRHITCFKPSTESAYIEQLKKEAFERFGEIKDGDRFKNVRGVCLVANVKGWGGYKYFKNTDSLGFGGVFIYQSGKWATKLPEMVKVELDYESFGGDPTYYFKCKADVNKLEGSGEYLAKCLFEYVNKEQ